MTTGRYLFLTGAVLVAAPYVTAESEAARPVDAALVGAGAPLWVDSTSEPGSLINARVDIGTLRREKDEIEARISWPVSPALRSIYRRSHPGVEIPEGSSAIDRERVICRPEGMYYYTVETVLVAPGGTLILRRDRDPAGERRKVEAAGKAGGPWANLPYGRDPRSLVCWAAARKCEGQPFFWPPPPNSTPLEHSERANRLRAEYYRMFVPACRP